MDKLFFKQILLGVFLLQFFCFHSFSQINSDGIPFITNYSPRTYNANEFNWSITQDHRGIMYFGNSNLILEYDGKNWLKIPVPEQTYILSLATGTDGTIYAGGIDDFGHLVLDSLGQLKYESLSVLVDDDKSITRVWKTYSNKDKIYFCTLKYIFIYDPNDKSIETIELPDDSFWSFLVNDNLFTSNIDLGLLEVNSEGKMQKAKGGDYFTDKDIFTVYPWSDDTLLIYSVPGGLSFYNAETGEVSGFDFNEDASSTNLILMESSVYTGERLNDSLFAFGTRTNGLFIINRAGSIVTHLNESHGLQNEIVTSLHYPDDQGGVLWLTLTNGISSVNISSPVKMFGTESGLNGPIYGIDKHKDSYYIATLQGVFRKMYLPNQQTVFSDITGISGEQVYTLKNVITPDNNEMLIAASTRDIYNITGSQANILFSDIETYQLLQSEVFPERIYVGTSRGLRYLYFQDDRLVFPDEEAFALNNETIRGITEDSLGNLWCETFTGIYLISPDGSEKDLPVSIKNMGGTFFSFDDGLFFVSDDRVFQYCYSDNEFHFFSPLNELFFEKGKELREVFPLDNTNLLAFYAKNNDLYNDIITVENDSWKTDTLSLRAIPQITTNIAFADSTYIFTGTHVGLFVYNDLIDKKFERSFNTLIRSVVIGADSLVYKGGEGFFQRSDEDNGLVQLFHSPIKFDYNNITFTYSSPYFENEEEIVYSSYLEGFDQDWSLWSTDISRSYTNLRHGRYKFHVKARNIYGFESQVSTLEFTVLPPWHQTWWAYLLYFVIGIAVIAISISLYTRKLQKDKKHLEEIVRERTAEILEKNEEIERKNKSITDSIRYAKRIQTAVLPDKQTSDKFEYFIYFKPKDIVSGDFYWLQNFEDKKKLIVAAADCTGHGVPGAFMSMLGTAFLNEIVAKTEIQHSDQILNVLRDYVIKALKQGVKEGEVDEQRDGMDIGLAVINLKTRVLEFSGANNSMLFFRNGELTEYKPDRMPIGTYRRQDEPFTRTEVKLQDSDLFYLFSDGYIDQFGGEEGSKYMKNRFKEFISNIHNKPLSEQKRLLEEEMEEWSKYHEQLDDQLIIGMRAVFDA